MEHVTDSTKIRPAHVPPSVEIIDHEIMLDLEIERLPHLVEFKPVEQGFVYSVGNAAAKSCRVVVLFDFSNRNGIDNAWKCSINSTRKTAHRKPVFREGSQFLWVIVAGIASHIRFD